MDLNRLRQINEQKAQQEATNKKHQELLLDSTQTQETIVKSFNALVRYLDNKVTKAHVVNQLTEIGTPDAMKVVTAVDSLHETLKTHENTDLSEITKVMQSILQEAKKIPKSHNDIDIPKPVDNTKQLESLEKAIKAVEKVVKEQKLIAEAPIINVPETNVNVEAPDLRPLQASIKDVVGAVKKIVIPKYETDNKEVEKLIKKSNKLLQELVDTPVSGGGGGGGRATPYQDSNSIPAFVTLNNGSIPIIGETVKQALTEKIDVVSATVTYIAQAQPGTLVSAAGWRIKKITVTGAVTDIQWADGVGTFTKIYDDRASYTYA